MLFYVVDTVIFNKYVFVLISVADLNCGTAITNLINLIDIWL